MFDLGWSELLVVGVVALIVVGPKDLPVLFRRAGEFVGRMRGLAREFSKAMNDAADQTGMKETAESLRTIADPKKMGLDGIKDSIEDATKWEPNSETAKLAAKRDAERKAQVEAANAAAEQTAREVREAHAAREAAESAKATKQDAPLKAGATAKKAAAKKAPAKKKTAPKKKPAGEKA